MVCMFVVFLDVDRLGHMAYVGCLVDCLCLICLLWAYLVGLCSHLGCGVSLLFPRFDSSG